MAAREPAAASSQAERDAFEGRPVLVTGGLGFIGSALVTRLARAGAKIHTASRRPAPQDGTGRHWRADLSDAAAVGELVREIRPDYVFHLASHVMGAPDLKHALPTFRGNLQSTVNLLCSLAETGCRRMLTTGSLVEPESGVRSVPNSPYAAAKWAASDYARMFHALYGFPVAIARVFMVYGPGQQDETKLVPYVIRCLLDGKVPEITSGAHRIDWIFVDDVVSGFVRMALTPDVDGKSVDLGSGTLITIRELVDRICELMETNLVPAYGALPDRPLEPLRIANVAESRRVLGWSPTVDLGEGLRRTIDWYRERR
jgi:nucleoside-diphosphate-sugar epimerase